MRDALTAGGSCAVQRFLVTGRACEPVRGNNEPSRDRTGTAEGASSAVVASATGAKGELKPLVLDDEVCDWEGEAIEGGFRASFFKPGGVLVRECDDDEFIRREGAKRVLDRFHRVGITDPRFNVVGWCGLRKLVGPLGCVSAGVVLGVCQPVESGDAGGWRDDEEPTRHGFSLSGSSTDANASSRFR